MPELPEVETTVRGINKAVKNLRILDVWSDYYKKTAHGHKQNLKNKKYFENFKKEVIGKKILNAERHGKNVIINLAGNISILTHMKMTGHYLYGKFGYSPKTDSWQVQEEGPLKDPYNRFAHLVFSLSNKNKLVLSDVRKFSKVILIKDGAVSDHPDLIGLGPDPLGKDFNFLIFKKAISSKTGPIKSVLMNQAVISGIGNIYSDEMLWEAGIHPEERPENIPHTALKKMFSAMLKVLKNSIRLGGDSASDYRQLTGEPGSFQNHHQVYRKKGRPCNKKNCSGIIERIVVRGRSSHFCPAHQKKC